MVSFVTSEGYDLTDGRVGSDGTVGSNKTAIKMIAKNTPLDAQVSSGKCMYTNIYKYIHMIIYIIIVSSNFRAVTLVCVVIYLVNLCMFGNFLCHFGTKLDCRTGLVQQDRDQDDRQEHSPRRSGLVREKERDRYFIAEEPAPAPHLAHPDGCAALRIVLVTVPRVSHFYEKNRMDSIFTSYSPESYPHKAVAACDVAWSVRSWALSRKSS